MWIYRQQETNDFDASASDGLAVEEKVDGMQQQVCTDE
jgi:hypothetical protein